MDNCNKIAPGTVAALAIEACRREIERTESERGDAYPLHRARHGELCDQIIADAKARIALIEADPIGWELQAGAAKAESDRKINAAFPDLIQHKL